MMSTEQERAKKTIRVGSRKSELALTQTKHVIALLQKLNPDVVYEIRGALVRIQTGPPSVRRIYYQYTMTTVGDRVLNKSLPKIGEKSLFTKDLEDALRTGGVDFVVHSLKDLPTALPVGMAIGAVLEREDPRDALVLNERHRGCTLATLPRGSVVGTSSLRRSAQLARYYPHLAVCDIRGNLNTRLAKLDADASKFAGIVLAQAGLVRMGWHKRIDQIIEPHEILYAVGQGALAVECRSNDDYILAMLAKLCHLETQCRILTERSFLRTLGGGCSAPVAVRTELKTSQEPVSGRKRASSGDDGETFQLHVQGAVWSLDGKTELRSEGECVLNLGESRPKSPRLDDRKADTRDDTPAAKKAKPSSGSSSPESAGRGCPIDHHQQRKKSPEIIADTDELLLLPGCSKDGGARLDLTKFIDIHGELFKKCPYSSELTKLATEAKQAARNGNDLEEEKEKGEEATTTGTQEDREEKLQTADKEAKSETDRCPSTRFPVGQEVMGDCPFVSTEEKVDLGGSLTVGLVCPVTGRKQENGSQKNGASTGTADKEQVPSTLADKCPFLAAKVLDYNEHLDQRQIAEPTLEDNSEQLFCGMHRHACVEWTVFERCEKLGYDLAHDLIAKGALTVMKCAQNEIHSKMA